MLGRTNYGYEYTSRCSLNSCWVEEAACWQSGSWILTGSAWFLGSGWTNGTYYRPIGPHSPDHCEYRQSTSAASVHDSLGADRHTKPSIASDFLYPSIKLDRQPGFPSAGRIDILEETHTSLFEILLFHYLVSHASVIVNWRDWLIRTARGSKYQLPVMSYVPGEKLTHFTQFIDVDCTLARTSRPKGDLRGEAKKSYLSSVPPPFDLFGRYVHGKQDIFTCDSHSIPYSDRPAWFNMT